MAAPKDQQHKNFVADEENGEEEVNILEIADLFGTFGKWQAAVFVLVALFSLSTAMNTLVIPLMAPDIKFWCDSRPPEYDNVSVDVWRNISQQQNDSCKMMMVTNNEGQDPGKNPNCESWEYDKSEFRSTIVEQFNLVCSRSWFISLSQSCYMAGYLCAMLSLGQIADKFGRRPVMLFAVVSMVASGFFCAYPVNFPFFAVCRALIAFTRNGFYLVAFNYLLEVVGSKYRSTLGIANQFGWAFGYLIVPGLAYWLRHWVHLQIAITIPSLLNFIFFWLCPESPRWLLSQGRIEDAAKVVRKVAAWNKKEVTNVEERLQKIYDTMQQEKKVRNYTIVDLFRTSGMRRNTVVVYFVWFTMGFSYYGLSFTASQLGGDLFINFFLAALVEFPAYTMILLLTLRVPRRISMLAVLAFSSLFCFIVLFIPEGYVWTQIGIATAGKFFISSAFALVYVFSSEVFPTVVRTIGFGTSSTFARVGAILSPYVKDLVLELCSRVVGRWSRVRAVSCLRENCNVVFVSCRGFKKILKSCSCRVV